MAFQTVRVAATLMLLQLVRCRSSNDDSPPLQNVVEHQFEQSSGIVQRRLTDDFVRNNDLCIDGGRIEICKKEKLRSCPSGRELCLERTPLTGRFFDKNNMLKYFYNKKYYDKEGNHPIFVIDYKKTRCAPRVDWNCDRCDNPSTFCRKAGHCMTKAMYKLHCTDASNSNASRIRSRNKRQRIAARAERRKQERQKRRREEREKKKEQGSKKTKMLKSDKKKDASTKIKTTKKTDKKKEAPTKSKTTKKQEKKKEIDKKSDKTHKKAE